jgi:hypothetical protein
MLITPNNAVIVSIITTVLYGPRGDKTAWPAEQSKEFPEPQWFRGATDDFRQQRMSGRGQAARVATSGLKADTILTSTSPTAGNRAAWANCSAQFRRIALYNSRVAKSQMRSWPNRHMVRLVGFQSVRRAETPSRRRQRTDEWMPDQLCGSFGMLSANPLKQASRSSCSLRKRQSITPFAAAGFGLGRGAMIAS